MKKTVKNASRSVVIQVTDEDITNGVRCSKNECVLALAWKNHPAFSGNDFKIEIGRNITKFHKTNEILRFATPKEMRKQLKEWDKGGQWILPPGTYEFGVLPEPPVLTKEQFEKRAANNLKGVEARKNKKTFKNLLPQRQITNVNVD